MKNPIKWLIAFVLSLAGASVMSQPSSFDKGVFEKLSFRAHACTGFVNTPSWQCTNVDVPAYLMRASDSKTMVFIGHGSEGLNRRHSDYAKRLHEMGVNAVVVASWEARGIGYAQEDYAAAAKRGGDSINQTLDILSVATEMKNSPEWAQTDFGYIGESMGGVTGVQLTRPYLRRAYSQLYGRPPASFRAIVSLYSGCNDRSVKESFLPTPLIFINGDADNLTPPANCIGQVSWMNERGGKAEIVVLPGQVHGFDGPNYWRTWPGENPSKCASITDDKMITLISTGKQYPATNEGYYQMRHDCIGMSPKSSLAGNKGDPTTGYKEWTKFFQEHLLN